MSLRSRGFFVTALLVAPATVALGQDEYAQDVTTTIQSLDRFWAQEFVKMKRPYQRLAGFYTYDMNVASNLPCNPAGLNAFYCPAADVIIWEEQHLMRPWHRDVGDFAPAFVIAHEWGHAIQRRLNISSSGNFTIQLELQADCFAGAWASFAENQEQILEDGDIDEAISGLLKVRDAVGTPWLDPTAHGTGSQRVEAFFDGYRGGGPRCFGNMPPPPRTRTAPR